MNLQKITKCKYFAGMVMPETVKFCYVMLHAK